MHLSVSFLAQFTHLNEKNLLHSLQIMIENRVGEVEQLKQQDEQHMVQWNQLLAEKDSQILELQDKLDSLLQPRMNSARSREELEAIADSEGGLVAVTKQLKNISALLMVIPF